MKGRHECDECHRYYIRENDNYLWTCDECMPIHDLRYAVSSFGREALGKFKPNGIGYMRIDYRVEGTTTEMLSLAKRIHDIRKKLCSNARNLLDQLEWMYRHNKEELKENGNDPRCRFWQLTFSSFLYEKVFSILKKPFGDGAAALKKLGKILEKQGDEVKIYGRGRWDKGQSEEILLDKAPIIEALGNCERLYRWASSFLKKAEDCNQEFLDHKGYCHKGEEDEASIFDLRRVCSLLDELYSAFEFLFGIQEKDILSVYFRGEEEERFMDKIEKEYRARSHREIRLIRLGDKTWEA